MIEGVLDNNDIDGNDENGVSSNELFIRALEQRLMFLGEYSAN